MDFQAIWKTLQEPSVTALVVVLIAGFLWNLCVRRFPSLLGNALLARIEHKNAKDLQKFKAEIEAQYSTVKASVDFLSATQSERRSRTIDSVGRLWESILEIEEIYRDASRIEFMFPKQAMKRVFETRQPAEIIDMLQEYRSVRSFTQKLKRSNECMDEKDRIFTGERLWILGTGIKAVHDTLGGLIRSSLEDKAYRDWRDNEVIRHLVTGILSKEVLEESQRAYPGGFSMIVGHLKSEFLKEATRVMSGSQALSESLADLQQAILLENQRISNPEFSSSSAHQ